MKAEKKHNHHRKDEYLKYTNVYVYATFIIIHFRKIIVWMSLSMHPLSFLFTSTPVIAYFFKYMQPTPQKQHCFHILTQMSVPSRKTVLSQVLYFPLPPVPSPSQTSQLLPDICSPTHGYRCQWWCCNAGAP